MCLDDRVRKAAKWLQAAFDGAHNLQNCTWRTSLDAGQEDAALTHLKEYLSWRVQRGRVDCAGWANAGRGHSRAHVQRVPCREVL